MNISDVAKILKLATLSPSESKTFIKLLSADVLKNLGNNELLLKSGVKEFSVKSEINLSEGSKVWAKIATLPDRSLQLLDAKVMPKLMQNLLILQDKYRVEDLQTLLKTKEPLSAFKKEVLEQLASSGSKEQFSALSQLLLSLNQSVLTIPIEYQNYYAILQMKKRYNKDSKKRSLDFYTALENLGEIEGTISLIDGEVYLHMNVAFEESLALLEKAVDDLSFSSKTTLALKESFEPLFNQESLTLLDIKL